MRFMTSALVVSSQWQIAVQRVDKTIQRINHYLTYLVDKCWQNKLCYQLDIDLSRGQRYPFCASYLPYKIIIFACFSFKALGSKKVAWVHLT